MTQPWSGLQTTTTDAGTWIHLNDYDDVFLALAQANQHGRPVSVDVGQAGESPFAHRATLLDYSRLNRIRSYSPDEYIITVEPGMRVGMLSHYLKPHYQRLGLYYGSGRSVLSLLGQETASLSAMRFFNLRRRVLGIEAVTGDGHYIHYGGDVVKNVTGYDLNKLFLGSQHQFGVLLAVTLKLEPLAVQTHTSVLHCGTIEMGFELAKYIMNQATTVESLVLFRTKSTFGWKLFLVLAGYVQAVELDRHTLQPAFSRLESGVQEFNISSDQLDEWVERLDWEAYGQTHVFTLKIALVKTQFQHLLQQWADEPWFQSADVLHTLDSNLCFLRWRSPYYPFQSELEQLKAAVYQAGGFIQIVACPGQYPALGAVSLETVEPVLEQLRCRLKRQFDPNHILMSTAPRGWVTTGMHGEVMHG